MTFTGQVVPNPLKEGIDESWKWILKVTSFTESRNQILVLS